MAIYRFEVKVIGRAGRDGGRSVVAAAAYRSGANLEDKKYEVRHDYSRRAAGVVFSEIIAPENAPAWASDREKLWNQVEAKEDTHNRRASAQLALEFIPALPHELSREQRQDLVMGFVNAELVSRGMVADVSIHEPKEGDNYHAHILCSMREIGPLGFGKKERSWNDTALLLELREAWEHHTNDALEKAGRSERVSCKSLADRGIEQEPQPKLGVAAAAMEKKGIVTERGQAVRETGFLNQVMGALRGVLTFGQVAEYPQFDGQSWWERMLDGAVEMAGAALDQVVAMVKDESSGGSWAAREDARRESRETEPDMGFEPG